MIQELLKISFQFSYYPVELNSNDYCYELCDLEIGQMHIDNNHGGKLLVIYRYRRSENEHRYPKRVFDKHQYNFCLSNVVLKVLRGRERHQCTGLKNLSYYVKN